MIVQELSSLGGGLRSLSALVCLYGVPCLTVCAEKCENPIRQTWILSHKTFL